MSDENNTPQKEELDLPMAITVSHLNDEDLWNFLLELKNKPKREQHVEIPGDTAEEIYENMLHLKKVIGKYSKKEKDNK